MLAAFAFNTAENLPAGLIDRIAGDLHVPLWAVGLLVSCYGLTVAVVSVPLAHLTRAVPRRHLLTGVLAALAVSGPAAALAPAYVPLLGARLVTALAQAFFWAVLGQVAAGLFAPRVRGRVLGTVSLAGSLALVAGVPAGTWIGRHDWRLPFGLLAVLALAALPPIAALLPTTAPDSAPAAYASEPDTRRFRVALVAVTLSATGGFAGFTYVVALLGGESGFAPGAISLLLVCLGVACLAGVAATGPFLDRFPWAALAAAVLTQSAALLGLAAARHQALAACFLALFGLALGPVFLAAQNAMLRHAPRRTDLALAANSGAYNAGIAAGAALGGLVLARAGVRTTFAAGGLVSLAAGLTLLRAARPRHPGSPPAPPGSIRR
ncbi:MFS transporter [Streptomyces sp. SPB074]|uniref:MFS transporter n=1 Tax=Streptomyces sp. (strain SPB074) TaxID=465543 RepID=UPI000997B39E|nr:MFS transporter [Streptomyces sp. SPB074]